MSARPRRPMVLRLLALFAVPLLAGFCLLIPDDSAILITAVVYLGALIGMGLFAAPAFVDGAGVCFVIGLALAIGMFFVHLFVAFAGCSTAVILS